MDQFEVTQLLKEGIVEVEFLKSNGDYRKMSATLKTDILPEVIREIEEKAEPRKKNDESLAVWDCDAKGWRSFRWDRLQKVDGVDFGKE